ncbi:MAG: cobalamin biosynthesis protein CobD [Magnetovibrio sp.]|nr:cobalamin biosynthesis protein CobD [Magnetovibrio sp.]
MFIFDSLGEAQNPYIELYPFILLVMAILVEAFVGDRNYITRYVKHPVIWIGDLIGFLDRKLNRDKRSNLARLIRGVLVVLVVIALVGTFSLGVSWLAFSHPWGWVIEFIFIISLLAGRSLYDHVLLVARGLEVSVESGRDAVRHIVGRDPVALDEHGIARAGIESLAENFADGVVAPVFWYVVLGFPGIAIYKAVNTMDSMIGYKNTRYRYFGFAAARLDDALNFLPARFSGILIIIAAIFVPRASLREALRIFIRDGSKHRSPNAGWTEAPVAGALDLALSGPRRYVDGVENDPWIGTGRARVTVSDIHRALYLYIVANILNIIVVVALLLLRISLLK